MTPGEAKVVLNAIFAREMRATVFLTGPPGGGKTAVVAQAAAEVGLPVRTLALPTCEAVDVRGIPQVLEGQTVWASPLPREGRGVLLLDELSSAPPDVQVAAHHVVWQEPGSDVWTPWHVVCTGNRASDKTVYRAPSAPLRNRLILLDVVPDVADWSAWAVRQGIAPVIVGFIRWRPELLFAKDIPAEKAFCSPRAWVRLNELLDLPIGAHLEAEVITGVVGDGAAAEFLGYLRLVRELPAVEAITRDQAGAPVPTSPSVLYALTLALAYWTREHQASLMRYVARLPAEFGVLYLRDVRDHYDIRADSDIRKWIGRHKRLFREEETKGGDAS